MPAPQPRYRQPKQLDAGSFQPAISSLRLHLAAEGKAAKTIRTYTEAVAWFAAHLPREVGLTRWEEVGRYDVQRWMVWLLGRYSAAYSSNQFRALQQFFKWLAAEEQWRPARQRRGSGVEEAPAESGWLQQFALLARADWPARPAVVPGGVP
jgi:integrase-like protein